MTRSPAEKRQPKRSTVAGGFGFSTRWSSWFRLRAQHAPLHRTQQLDTAERIKSEAARDTLRDDLDQLGHTLLGLADLDHVEVARLASLGRLGHLACVDAVRVDHDPAH